MDTEQEPMLYNFIEVCLSAKYEQTPDLTGGMCVVGIDNAIIALKEHFGFAKNETVLSRPVIDDIVENVVHVGLKYIHELDSVTMKDYIAVITKIKKTVMRHAVFGPRAYYDFIRQDV